MDVLGRVTAVLRYPVKSMAAEPLEWADVGWHGVAGDRSWAFVREAIPGSGFPYLTIRERPELWRFAPRFVDPGRPDRSAVMVRTPQGDELDVLDPALGDRLGGGVRTLKLDRGTFDVAPVSLITSRSVAGAGALVGRTLDPLRFRPNLLVEAALGDAFPEDAWVGATLRIGGACVRVDQRDERCAMVNVDPETTDRDPAILKQIGRERDACLGVYAQVVAPGRIAVGDEVIQASSGALRSNRATIRSA